jgi:hypothetical protein
METVVGCSVLFGVVAAINLFLAWLLVLLWNWLMPMLFGLPEINIWISLGLMVLVSLLFSGSSKK